MIRAGKGPFHNVNAGGVHMHHSTPGIILLIAGAFTAVGCPPLSVWSYLAALLVGLVGGLLFARWRRRPPPPRKSPAISAS